MRSSKKAWRAERIAQVGSTGPRQSQGKPNLANQILLIRFCRMSVAQVHHPAPNHIPSPCRTSITHIFLSLVVSFNSQESLDHLEVANVGGTHEG